MFKYTSRIGTNLRIGVRVVLLLNVYESAVNKPQAATPRPASIPAVCPASLPTPVH
ncbi:MAG: hypothetical protein WCE68_04495 [Anaerolineales bacterium]